MNELETIASALAKLDNAQTIFELGGSIGDAQPFLNDARQLLMAQVEEKTQFILVTLYDDEVEK